MRSIASKVRSMIRAGNKPKDISAVLGVSRSKIYNQKYLMKKSKRASTTPVVSIPRADTSMSDFVRAELATLERQIENLNTIASFMSIRLRQLEQNGE